MDRTVAANHWRRIGAPHHDQAQALVNAHPPIPQRGSESTPLPRYTTPGDEMGGAASSLEKKYQIERILSFASFRLLPRPLLLESLTEKGSGVCPLLEVRARK